VHSSRLRVLFAFFLRKQKSSQASLLLAYLYIYGVPDNKQGVGLFPLVLVCLLCFSPPNENEELKPNIQQGG
jgi:hypothetical protein